MCALPDVAGESGFEQPNAKILYLDQNAWVELARGAWDKDTYCEQHRALTTVVRGIEAGRLQAPISFTNLYETAKINDPVRRANMARTQALISGGRVFRGRRRILTEMLRGYLAGRFDLPCAPTAPKWFLSDLWFEAAADYTPESHGYAFSEEQLAFFRARPAEMLFDYLAFGEEATRIEAVKRFSAGSATLVAGIEQRRALVAGETLAMRKRAYGAQLLVDELDFILSVGRQLNLPWNDARDIGSSLARGIIADIPMLNVERELAIRLEDQAREVCENDIRDMSAFVVTLPLADIVVAEKPFVNLARQAGLGKRYETQLLTSVFDLTSVDW